MNLQEGTIEHITEGRMLAQVMQDQQNPVNFDIDGILLLQDFFGIVKCSALDFEGCVIAMDTCGTLRTSLFLWKYAYL